MILQKDIEKELKELKPTLSAKYFVDKIGYFGSFARNEQTENSDIDIVVSFKKPVGIEFIDLADYLESMFHRKIDLVSLKGIKAKYYSEIEKEIIYV